MQKGTVRLRGDADSWTCLRACYHTGTADDRMIIIIYYIHVDSLA